MVILSVSGLKSYRCYNLKMQIRIQQENESHEERKKPTHNKGVNRKPVVGIERSKHRNLKRTMCLTISLAIAMYRHSQILIETLIDFGVRTGRSTRSNGSPKAGEKGGKSIIKL